MSTMVKIARKSEISPGTALKAEVNGKEIAIFNIDGNFYAIDDTCQHRGGPLSEGSCDNHVVTCPWHGWEYDVTTGACLTNSGVSQTKYDVKVEGDDIFVST